MNLKKISILLLILILLLIAVWYVDKKEEKKKAVEGKLYILKPDSIDKIILKRHNKVFEFNKKDNIWYLSQPVKEMADKSEIQNIIDNFSELQFDRLVENDAKDLKKYGLNKPEIRLILYSNNKKIKEILIGIKNEMDSSSYTKTGDENKVVLIASYRRDYLEKELFDYRDKSITDFNTVDAESIEFTYKKINYSFVKKNKDWYMEKPIKSLAKESVIEALLSDISGLEAKSFLENKENVDINKYNFNKPELNLTIKLKNNKFIEIKISKKDDKYYIISNTKQYVCEISKDILNGLKDNVKDYRENKVAKFFAYSVKELELNYNKFKVNLFKDKDDNWKLKNNKKEVDNSKINDFLSTIESLEAVDFIDNNKKLNFVYNIKMKVEDDEDLNKLINIELRFTNPFEGEYIFAKNNKVNYIFKIKNKDKDKFIKTLKDILKKQETKNNG